MQARNLEPNIVESYVILHKMWISCGKPCGLNLWNTENFSLLAKEMNVLGLFMTSLTNFSLPLTFVGWCIFG